MINRIAYRLGRNDEAPNIALALQLCETKDGAAVEQIVAGLKDKQPQIANDCVKVLYEIGKRDPELIADYAADFLHLLISNNNRLVWGGMMALSKIVSLRPKEVFDNIQTVLGAYRNGSVITRDYSITVFAELSKADQKYEKVLYKKILDHLNSCRPKEVGQHAERAFVCVHPGNVQQFIAVLQNREDLTESQKKRVDKLIKKAKQFL